jgi:predicted nucleic acid-binding Zn ribbon protein
MAEKEKSKKSGIKKHPKPPKPGEKAGKLLQHRHCQACAKAIPLSEEFCSEECENEFQDTVKKRRNWLYIYVAITIGVVILFILMGT